MEQAYEEAVGPAATLNPGFQVVAIKEIGRALNMLLADVFALFLKTKNFQWHLSDPDYCQYRRMLREEGRQLFEMTDLLAERMRKIGGVTLRSISHIGRLQRILDSDNQYVAPHEMMTELREDNAQLLASMRGAHALCEEYGDVPTAGLLKSWIDSAEERVCFLLEACKSKNWD